MYNTTAFLYDATSAFEEPQYTCDEICRILATYGVQPPGVLGDLGSGTGLMSVLFAEKGWRVQGIELSEAMIKVACQKRKTLPMSLQSKLTWKQGDISSFEMPADLLLDAAVCLCNTINHLAEWSQVKAFIRSAYRALKSNGILILDSDTLMTFEGFFHHGPVVVWNDGQHRMTRACEFEPDTGRASHTAILERHVEQGWQSVSQEIMALQYHPETNLFVAFTEQGFKIEQAEAFNPSPKLYQGFVPKLLWVLRKPA